MRVGARVDELHGHVDAGIRVGNGSFENAIDSKPPSDFRQGAGRALVLHHRRSGDDAQSRILGKHGSQFVGHAVGEIILAGIAGKIVEGKHGQRGDVRFAREINPCGDDNQQRAESRRDEPPGILRPDP